MTTLHKSRITDLP